MKNNRKIRKAFWVMALVLLFAGGIHVTMSQPQTVEAATVKDGWKQVKGNWYYYRSGVKVKKNWIQDHNKWYYFRQKTGVMAKKRFISWKGNKYYLNNSGVMVTGWKQIKGRWYYFNSSSGVMKKGWLVLSTGKFYLAKSGKMYRPGWHTIKDKKYYMADSGAVVTGIQQIEGRKYKFDSSGALIKTYSSTSKKQLQKPTTKKTIRNFLLNALRPIGKTSYHLGGGWGGAGMTKSIPSGMDCSGYVGWTTYQVLGTNKQNNGAYSFKSYELPNAYKSWKLGYTYSHATLAKGGYKGKFKAGDIVRNYQGGTSGHVWIVIGQCSDGSYVLVHTSGSGQIPHSVGCTQIAGTPAPDGSTYGNGNSEAIKLAKTYMNRYFGSTVKRHNIAGTNTWATDQHWYITSPEVKSFRFKSSVLSDPNNYKSKSAAQILKDMFGEN